MRAIVVGGSGQIGGWLLRHLAERGHEAVGTYQTVATPGLVHLDGADPRAVDWLHAQSPDIVFYPAGFTYVDGCERDPAKARAANLDQPIRLARGAADVGARFVYFSTDYVFDGSDGPNAESDPSRPINVYGLAKSEAELALTEALGSAALIARTAWVYGPERQGKNFAYGLIRTLSRGETSVQAHDMASNPSYAPDVALACVRLAEIGQSGVIHVAGPEVMSRAEFARGIAKGFGFDPARIVGESSSRLGLQTPRPLRGGMRTNRIEALLPGLLRQLGPAVADFRSRLDGDAGWLDPRLNL